MVSLKVIFIRNLDTLKSHIIGYADDFILCFSNKRDAERVYEVLPKRLAKYGLSLNTEKTQLLDLTGNSKNHTRTFDFLGFTHYMGKSRKDRRILKRKTSSKKFSKSLQEPNEWFRRNLHKPIKDLMKTLNSKVRGDYNYYGINVQ